MGAGLFVSEDLVSVDLEDLHVLEGLAVNHHPDEGDLSLKPRVACRAWIDVKQVQLLVIHYFEDM